MNGQQGKSRPAFMLITDAMFRGAYGQPTYKQERAARTRRIDEALTRTVNRGLGACTGLRTTGAGAGQLPTRRPCIERISTILMMQRRGLRPNVSSLDFGSSGGSRTHTSRGHWFLKPGRLPIPPRSRVRGVEQSQRGSNPRLCLERAVCCRYTTGPEKSLSGLGFGKQSTHGSDGITAARSLGIEPSQLRIWRPLPSHLALTPRVKRGCATKRHCGAR